MTSLQKPLYDLKLQIPPYYAPDDTNINHAKKDSLPLRIFYVALPFIALHKPFGRVITLTMDSIKTVSCFTQLIDKRNCQELLKMAVATAALAGSLFLHPLGLCVSTLYDLGCDVTGVIVLLQAGNAHEAIFKLLSMTEHLFYLWTMIAGSLEIIALSMLLNMAVEICRSKKEFQKGNLIEGSSHLLMSLVRFSQAVPYIEKVAYKHEVKGKQLVRSLNETVTKVRNQTAIFFYSSARFLVSAHWKMTDFWIKTISLCKDDQSSNCKKVFSVAKSTISSLVLLPFALGGLALGQACHFSAFLLSTTPFIYMKGKADIKKITDKKLSIFQDNCCFTAGGFSSIFGGTVMSNDQRAQKIAEMIKSNDPDLVALQEVSDLKDALALYQALSEKYSEFYFNTGDTPFILQNNGGLLLASKVAIKDPEFHSFSNIKGTESMVNKGFFLFSTEIGNFISTHLSPSHDDLNPTDAEIQTRSQEQERIFLAAKRRSSENNKPSFVLGDFNINWNGPEYRRGLLFTESKDRYNQGRKSVSDRDATAETEYLIDNNWHHKKDAKPQHLILDYFLSLFQQDSHFEVTTKKIDTFDVNNPESAISDHAVLMTNI